ncbi:mast cell protease 8-like [Fundulus heteroclitus]|uniref:mast cell protease 8-like n=1 Tax=Fundulus heteroclitus TaxID=8078 RepID=UPI00165AF34E|nr:mast cell protease 8-like [Fundulus heteroclitus]
MHGLGQFVLFNVLVCLGQTVHGSDIIHGEKAPNNSMLYMVSVQNFWRHVCGGFLVSEDYVVTAAHCTEGKPDRVLLGSQNLRTENMTMKIESKCTFPNYTSVEHGDDLMLLKLSGKAPLGNGLKTIPLASPETKLRENQICSVAGWGGTGKDRFVNDLRVVNVSIINPELCQKKWEIKVPPNVICAGGYPMNKGFCQGDSGGPLVCDGIAVGVVSFNRMINNNSICNYPDVPNIYTDVSKYVPWINNILKAKKVECKRVT